MYGKVINYIANSSFFIYYCLKLCPFLRFCTSTNALWWASIKTFSDHGHLLFLCEKVAEHVYCVSVPNRTKMRNLVCLTLLLVAVSISTSEGSGKRVRLLD